MSYEEDIEQSEEHICSGCVSRERQIKQLRERLREANEDYNNEVDENRKLLAEKYS